MLRSDFCDCSDAYIVLKGRMTVEGTNPVNRRNKKLTFKNIGPYRSCISKINNTFTGNAEDIFMPMYNLSEYSDNYCMTSGSLWNYYRGELNDNANKVVANLRLNNNKATASK